MAFLQEFSSFHAFITDRLRGDRRRILGLYRLFIVVCDGASEPVNGFWKSTQRAWSLGYVLQSGGHRPCDRREGAEIWAFWTGREPGRPAGAGFQKDRNVTGCGGLPVFSGAHDPPGAGFVPGSARPDRSAPDRCAGGRSALSWRSDCGAASWFVLCFAGECNGDKPGAECASSDCAMEL